MCSRLCAAIEIPALVWTLLVYPFRTRVYHAVALWWLLVRGRGRTSRSLVSSVDRGWVRREGAIRELSGDRPRMSQRGQRIGIGWIRSNFLNLLFKQPRRTKRHGPLQRVVCGTHSPPFPPWRRCARRQIDARCRHEQTKTCAALPLYQPTAGTPSWYNSPGTIVVGAYKR